MSVGNYILYVVDYSAHGYDFCYRIQIFKEITKTFVASVFVMFHLGHLLFALVWVSWFYVSVL